MSRNDNEDEDEDEEEEEEEEENFENNVLPAWELIYVFCGGHCRVTPVTKIHINCCT